MLNVRLEGDAAEAEAFVQALRAAGAEVMVGTTKNRGGGLTHVYTTVRMPGYTPPEPGPAAPTAKTAVVQGRALGGHRRY